MMEKFSVAIIARNEEKTLPRLLDSLKGVDDCVVVDTGSTDSTVRIARDMGCRVYEEGERFLRTATKEHLERFREKFGMNPTFREGDRFFHYSDARNHALSLARNDWVFQPDADEVVSWDIGNVMSELGSEDQLTYRFCFAHNQDGTCALEFGHSKFFRKSKVKWEGWVHEVPVPIYGQEPKEPKYVDHIYHRHYQNTDTKRSNYLGGLELSVLDDFRSDRNLFYLAREYFYDGRNERAVDMFDIALGRMWWKPERGQARIFKAKCLEALGEDDMAEESLHLSLKECDTRREPFFELGEFHAKRGRPLQAIPYWLAALGVGFSPHGYLNEMSLYGWLIHDRLATTYSMLGDKEKAKEHWTKCLSFQDCDKRVLSNIAWFHDCPKISIVVPTCRPEGFRRLEKSLKENVVYPNWEIVEMSIEGSAVWKFNKGVSKSDGKYILYMADDTEATLGMVERAFVHLQEKLGGRGCVILNDGHWNGSIANHFLISRDMVDELGGEIWHSGYTHNCVDDELYCRLKAKKIISYCPEARIIHHHHFSGTPGKMDPKDRWNLKAEESASKDRSLLVKRLENLGLKEDAERYRKWMENATQSIASGTN